MDHKIEELISSAAAFLKNAAAKNGSFASVSSAYPDFRIGEETRTTFGTAIVLGAIAEVSELAATARRAAAFLVRERGPHWTFNYWQKRAPQRKAMPYPDNLDDTAAALTAITKVLPQTISGAVMAEFVKILTELEVSPGGPYRTWIGGSSSSIVPKDVDLAVNASIGRFLAEKRVSLPRLAAFAENHIERGNYASRYYPGPYAAIYFLSFWYRGRLKDKLIRDAARLGAAAAAKRNSLDAALAATALIRLGRINEGGRLIHKIAPLQSRDGSFPPHPFSVDPEKRGRKHFGGSDAITSAIVLEAASMYLKGLNKLKELEILEEKRIREAPFRREIEKMIAASAKKLPAGLRRGFSHLKERVESMDKRGEIILLPYRFAASLKKRVPEDIPVLLGAANFYGWMAYGAYDSILDGHAGLELIPPANAALREMTRIYSDIFPWGTEGRRLFEAALNKVDSRNAWELEHAQNPAKPPVYKDAAAAADKSLGHALGPLAVFILAGNKINSPQFRSLEEFFLSYLSAQQILGDIEDWKKDWKKGRITPAVSATLSFQKRAGQSSPSALFWKKGIPLLLGTVEREIRNARTAAQKLKRVLDANVLLELLRPLEKAVNAVKTERRVTLEFIAAYRRAL
jgi:hypothetical protein